MANLTKLKKLVHEQFVMDSNHIIPFSHYSLPSSVTT